MRAIRLYMASKSVHGPKWQKLRDGANWPIISTWINESGEGESADLADLWRRCVAEATMATHLIAYHEEGEEWKGAFIEIGAALAFGVPVLVVGNPPGSWVNHSNVHRFDSVADALQAVAKDAIL